MQRTRNSRAQRNARECWCLQVLQMAWWWGICEMIMCTMLQIVCVRCVKIVHVIVTRTIPEFVPCKIIQCNEPHLCIHNNNNETLCSAHPKTQVPKSTQTFYQEKVMQWCQCKIEARILEWKKNNCIFIITALTANMQLFLPQQCNNLYSFIKRNTTYTSGMFFTEQRNRIGHLMFNI